jgi:hypothetical protein
MKKKLFLIILAICISTVGCSKLFEPTYPKDKLTTIIPEICKEEYKITDKISVKISGKTLAVRIELDQLLDKNLKLQESSLEKLQNLLKVIRRVCLSTDAELDFFLIIGYEKTLGIEVIFYSYIDDLKRAMAGWMSPDDYFQRLIKNMQLDTLRWGNNRIEKFIKDIESGNMVKLLVNNFPAGLKMSELSPEFLKILTDLSKKTYIKWSIVKMNSVSVGGQERLYYIEAKEQYTPIPEEQASLQYPSGTVHKFYLLLNVDDLKTLINNIYTPSKVPEKYMKFGTPSKWDPNDFFIEDFTFQDFLSTQIVQQIQSELSSLKKENEEIELSYSLKGDFIIKDKIDTQVKLKDPSNNIFKVTLNPKKNNVIDLPKKTIDIMLKSIREVCEKYKFYDIREIQFVDNKGNALAVIDKLTLFKSK